LPSGLWPYRREPCTQIVTTRVLIHTHVVRVEIQSGQLVIELANAKSADRKRKQSRSVIQVPWRKTLSTRHREILVPETAQPRHARPIRSENRALLVASIARGRRWLDELIADPAATTESIAGREGCTTRKINMTISLAFLAPDLVKAAIDGQLPHGMGVARLADLSAEWSRQRKMLGGVRRAFTGKLAMEAASASNAPPLPLAGGSWRLTSAGDNPSSCTKDYCSTCPIACAGRRCQGHDIGRAHGEPRPDASPAPLRRLSPPQTIQSGRHSPCRCRSPRAEIKRQGRRMAATFRQKIAGQA
jgi:hypothetical protein